MDLHQGSRKLLKPHWIAGLDSRARKVWEATEWSYKTWPSGCSEGLRFGGTPNAGYLQREAVGTRRNQAERVVRCNTERRINEARQHTAIGAQMMPSQLQMPHSFKVWCSHCWVSILLWFNLSLIYFWFSLFAIEMLILCHCVLEVY